MKSPRVMIAVLLITSSVFFSRSVPAQVATSETSPEDAASSTKLPAPKFFYSTEYLNGKVGGYLVNRSTGELSSTGQPPVWAHYGPTKIASDSGGYRLYVANQAHGQRYARSW